MKTAAVSATSVLFMSAEDCIPPRQVCQRGEQHDRTSPLRNRPPPIWNIHLQQRFSIAIRDMKIAAKNGDRADPLLKMAVENLQIFTAYLTNSDFSDCCDATAVREDGRVSTMLLRLIILLLSAP